VREGAGPPGSAAAATKLAIVLPPRGDFSPAAAGAIGIVVHRLARAGGPGFAPLVLGPASALPPFPDVAFSPLRAGWWPPGPHAWRYGIAACRRLRALIPALIEVHNRPDVALLLARRFAPTPVVLFLHNDPREMRGARTGAERLRLFSRLARVVTVSEFLRGLLLEGLAEAPRAAVLANPIECAALPAPVPAGAREQVLLFAGRMVRDKGADSFVAAAEAALPRLPGWRAEMFGADRPGPDAPETSYVRALRRRASAAGIEVHGYRPHGEVLAAMARAAIVVVPSRWAEPFGLTALEALAEGAALIAAPRGALPEVAGQAALYAEPDPPGALAEAMVALATDPGRRAGLGAAGIARAKKFDLPEVAARLAKLRSEVLHP
jgi:UDP-glucose:(glucosyl)LPS alpha-1,2-glucosyltransferase